MKIQIWKDQVYRLNRKQLFFFPNLNSVSNLLLPHQTMTSHCELVPAWFLASDVTSSQLYEARGKGGAWCSSPFSGFSAMLHVNGMGVSMCLLCHRARMLLHCLKFNG